MKIINPNYVAPASLPFQKRKAVVLAALAALPAGKPDVDFDEIRAALSLDDTQLPDGAIAQIAADGGFKVVA